MDFSNVKDAPQKVAELRKKSAETADLAESLRLTAEADAIEEEFNKKHQRA